MKRIMSLLIVLFTLLPTTVWGYVYNDAHTFQTQLETARQNTVAITTSKVDRYTWDTFYTTLSIGTGTMIGNGLILTNAHVIKEGQNEIAIRTYTGESYIGTLLRVDNEKDLALVSFDSDEKGFSLADVADLYKGKPVMTVGQPVGLPQWSFSEGTIQSLDYDYTCQGKAYIGYMSDNQNLGGNSGGPLLDTNGELVGIIRAKVEGNDYALSIPMSDIKTFLEGEK